MAQNTEAEANTAAYCGKKKCEWGMRVRCTIQLHNSQTQTSRSGVMRKNFNFDFLDSSGLVK